MMNDKEKLQMIAELIKTFNYWKMNLTDASKIFEQIEDILKAR